MMFRPVGDKLYILNTCIRRVLSPESYNLEWNVHMSWLTKRMQIPDRWNVVTDVTDVDVREIGRWPGQHCHWWPCCGTGKDQRRDCRAGYSVLRIRFWVQAVLKCFVDSSRCLVQVFDSSRFSVQDMHCMYICCRHFEWINNSEFIHGGSETNVSVPASGWFA